MARPAWRVCVTRDEGPEGPLGEALRRRGFDSVHCAVLLARRPEDPSALEDAAARLHEVHWVIGASARAVRALADARQGGWPTGVRTAAVGAATARAFVDAGAVPPPVVGEGDGAAALWRTLQDQVDWRGQRVLVPTTPGGRRVLGDGLRSAGASVEEVEAYRMCARERTDIAADWAAAAPDAVVLASPRAAGALIDAVGAEALRRLRAVVAIGHTTSEALAAAGVPALVPERADFGEAARTLVEVAMLR
jgi:uroporphyrinogen-III synthase